MAPINPLVVKVQNAFDFTNQDRLQQDKLRVYKTLSRNRGLVKIINVETTPNHPPREGSDIDVDNLTNLFKQIGFRVEIYPFSQTNHTKKGILKCLEEFVEDEYLKEADIAILFIMSHGNRTREGRDFFYTVDGEAILCKDVEKYFSNGWCKYMQNKPKMIFFQTCRGNNLDKGYKSIHESFQTDGTRSSSTKIPRVTDLLVAYATSPDYVALRWPSVGSLFIHTLCNEFMRNAHKRDVSTMLSNIYWEMTQIEATADDGRCFQAGVFSSMVFGHCFLNPGVYQDINGVYKNLTTNEDIQNVIIIQNDKELIEVKVANDCIEINCCNFSENAIKQKINDMNGKSLLHIAVEHGHVNCCKKLIKAGADVDAEDDDKCTPLHLVAVNNNVECFKILLVEGAMLFAKSKTGDSPLHLAALNGSLDVGEMLLIEKVSVDAVNADKSTPLHLAAACGNVKFCTILLEAKANINATNRMGATALHFAVKYGHTECCDKLIKCGAPIDATTNLEEINGSCILRLSADVNSIATYTPLQYAAREGQSTCLQVLIDLGACIDANDNWHGFTALHLAAFQGHLRCCNILKNAGANIFSKNAFGNTAMHVAAMRGQWKCCMFFVDAGMNIQMKNNSGKTPLDLAKEKGHTLFINNMSDYYK